MYYSIKISTPLAFNEEFSQDTPLEENEALLLQSCRYFAANYRENFSTKWSDLC